LIYKETQDTWLHGFDHVRHAGAPLSLNKFYPMKKIFTMAIGLMALGLYAQKPEKENITTELGVSLGNGGNTVNTFGINGRYFAKTDLALVLGLGASFSQDVKNYAENTDGSGDEGTFTYQSRYTELYLGAQKHFAGTSRLSPFVGADFLLGTEGTHHEGDDAGTSGYVKNYSYERNAQSARAGIRAAVGFDFWVAKGLYIGAIYHPLSITLQMQDETKTTTGTNGSTVKTVNPGGTYTSLSTFGQLGSVRVGWLF
jgi:hypothetical protein